MNGRIETTAASHRSWMSDCWMADKQAHQATRFEAATVNERLKASSILNQSKTRGKRYHRQLTAQASASLRRRAAHQDATTLKKPQTLEGLPGGVLSLMSGHG